MVEIGDGAASSAVQLSIILLHTHTVVVNAQRENGSSSQPAVVLFNVESQYSPISGLSLPLVTLILRHFRMQHMKAQSETSRDCMNTNTHNTDFQLLDLEPLPTVPRLSQNQLPRQSRTTNTRQLLTGIDQDKAATNVTLVAPVQGQSRRRMINPAVDAPAPVSSTPPTPAQATDPPSLPYLFYHDIESTLTTPPPLTNLHSLLRTFTPPLLPSSPYQPPTLASLFAALDQPYGFECLLSVNHAQQHTYFIPFLSAIFLYSQPSPSQPSAHLLFSHTDSLPPHTRYPLPYQIHHLLQHQPMFAGLLNVPLTELGDKSWLSLYWSPVLVDLHHEHLLAGYFLAYYNVQLNKRAANGSGRGMAATERDRLAAASSAGSVGGNVSVQEGEAAADEEEDEPGRREGEVDEESKESFGQQDDVTSSSRRLNGSITSHAADEEEEGEEDDTEGADENAADEGAMAPPPLEMDDAQLLLIGYVGCKVDESTWYGEGGQLEGDESAVTDTFTAYRLASGGADSRVTHVDVENELYDLLNSDVLVHPDYLHAVQHTKAR